VDPADISHKTVEKPTPSRVPPTLIAGGDWDRVLEPIEDDIVYKSFYKRFEEGCSWSESGYVDFLTTDVSEHGGCSRKEAFERCRKMDWLYGRIKEQGYRSQSELEREGQLIDDLTSGFTPPEYREVAVNITRDGELVWHAGMHRLVIAQLLDLDRIPVRIHVRHERWQEIREAVWEGINYEEYRDHPDVKRLIQSRGPESTSQTESPRSSTRDSG
jgi:hypothetical protein